jgi:hypothetical protein
MLGSSLLASRRSRDTSTPCLDRVAKLRLFTRMFRRSDVCERVGRLSTAPDAEIARRHGIEAAEVEDREDVDGPRSDGGNAGQASITSLSGGSGSDLAIRYAATHSASKRPIPGGDAATILEFKMISEERARG